MVMAGAMQTFTGAALLLSQDEDKSKFDPRASAMDFVPKYIKESFNLPNDMSGLDVDYDEVRTTD